MQDDSQEDHAPETFVTSLSSIEAEPLEAAYRLECTLKARWALKITGKDEAGNARVLALDWDGVWHPLDPVTGLPARIGTVVRFRDLRGRRGRLLRAQGR